MLLDIAGSSEFGLEEGVLRGLPDGVEAGFVEDLLLGFDDGC